ncbi:MAG: hypothetical protein QOH06_4105 [Acidobacteriota bacterium]|nr:hypothetical protein [Acidobacteriota bacterium]
MLHHEGWNYFHDQLGGTSVIRVRVVKVMRYDHVRLKRACHVYDQFPGQLIVHGHLAPEHASACLCLTLAPLIFGCDENARGGGFRMKRQRPSQPQLGIVWMCHHG